MGNIIDAIDRTICLFADTVQDTFAVGVRVVARIFALVYMMVALVVVCGAAYLGFLGIKRFFDTVGFLAGG